MDALDNREEGWGHFRTHLRLRGLVIHTGGGRQKKMIYFLKQDFNMRPSFREGGRESQIIEIPSIFESWVKDAGGMKF